MPANTCAQALRAYEAERIPRVHAFLTQRMRMGELAMERDFVPLQPAAAPATSAAA